MVRQVKINLNLKLNVIAIALKPCQMMSGNRQITLALLIVNQDDQLDEHQTFFNHNIWLNRLKITLTLS